jgi:hypothetical protein
VGDESENAITVRPHPGSVTVRDMKIGMVLAIRSTLSIAAKYPLKECVVTTLPDAGGHFYTITREQANRFTLQELESGKLDGLGKKRHIYDLGIGPIENGRWCHFAFCTEETPENADELFATI